jgi:hypothetical protein
MILQIYHCNLAVFEDRRESGVKNRPHPITRVPEYPGGADIRYLPPTDGFDDKGIGQLLDQFQDISIDGSKRSAVQIDWDHLSEVLQLETDQVRELIQLAHERGLITGLTLHYNHRPWMRLSHNKGCLVVMICVEESDYVRSTGEVARSAIQAISNIRAALIGKKEKIDWLNHVFLVPNVHLGVPVVVGRDTDRNIKILNGIEAGLQRRKWIVGTNSYGYTKIVEMAINAHVIGFVSRTV